EAFSIRAPLRHAELCIGVECDFVLGAVRYSLDANGRLVTDEVSTIGPRIDAEAGEAKHRVGYHGDRRIPHGIDEQHVVPGRADTCHWCRPSVQNVQDFFGRLLVSFLSQPRNDADEQADSQSDRRPQAMPPTGPALWFRTTCWRREII